MIWGRTWSTDTAAPMIRLLNAEQEIIWSTVIAPIPSL